MEKLAPAALAASLLLTAILIAVGNPIDPAKLTSSQSFTSQLVDLPDGGAASMIWIADGGVQVLSSHPCVWRPKGGKDCLRKSPVTGKSIDFGEENTFLATEAVGAGCIPKACSIMSGQTDMDPASFIKRKK